MLNTFLQEEALTQASSPTSPSQMFFSRIGPPKGDDEAAGAGTGEAADLGAGLGAGARFFEGLFFDAPPPPPRKPAAQPPSPPARGMRCTSCFCCTLLCSFNSGIPVASLSSRTLKKSRSPSTCAPRPLFAAAGAGATSISCSSSAAKATSGSSACCLSIMELAPCCSFFCRSCRAFSTRSALSPAPEAGAGEGGAEPAAP